MVSKANGAFNVHIKYKDLFKMSPNGKQRHQYNFLPHPHKPIKQFLYYCHLKIVKKTPKCRYILENIRS